MSDLIEENLKVIYNSNNDSPVFTRIAEGEINNGNFDKAILLLEKGIKNFPNYSTSYFLYSEALLAVGKIKEAEKVLQTGIDFVGFQDTADYYLNLIPKFDAPQIEQEAEETKVEKDDLLELADKLSNAKMDVQHSNEPAVEIATEVSKSPSQSPDRGLVSETLARIYFSQGNFGEAKEIYETLIEIQPEREDYYKGKLAEIDMQLGPKS